MITTSRFERIVWNHYEKQGRHLLPWRRTRDPYRILVSEVMLQQTQVDRVLPRYKSFIKRFPTFRALARASTADVLREWQGLGYNRRGLALKRAAEAVVGRHRGALPALHSELVALPGVGPYTAGALLAFVYDEPVVFIETNIRTAFIHHFFPKRKVSDAELLPLIESTLDRKRPREWYYALMDYGAHLKRTAGNASRGSMHYKKQTKFKGSRRELRGAILRELAGKTSMLVTLAKKSGRSVAETREALRALIKEGLVEERRRRFMLPRHR